MGFDGWGLLTDGLTACLFKLRQGSSKALAIAEASTIIFEVATAHLKALKAAA